MYSIMTNQLFKSPTSKQDTANGQAQRKEDREGSYHSINVLQHDRDREDGSRFHRQVKELRAFRKTKTKQMKF